MEAHDGAASLQGKALKGALSSTERSAPANGMSEARLVREQSTPLLGEPGA